MTRSVVGEWYSQGLQELAELVTMMLTMVVWLNVRFDVEMPWTEVPLDVCVSLVETWSAFSRVSLRIRVNKDS